LHKALPGIFTFGAKVKARIGTIRISKKQSAYMSITNIISNDEVTLVQGVDGLFFCEESWITQSRAASRSEEAFPEEVIEIKNEGISMEQLQT
jgi:hypothetical protein